MIILKKLLRKLNINCDVYIFSRIYNPVFSKKVIEINSKHAISDVVDTIGFSKVSGKLLSDWEMSIFYRNIVIASSQKLALSSFDRLRVTERILDEL